MSLEANNMNQLNQVARKEIIYQKGYCSLVNEQQEKEEAQYCRHLPTGPVRTGCSSTEEDSRNCLQTWVFKLASWIS